MKYILIVLHNLSIYALNFLSKIVLPFFLFPHFRVHYRNLGILYSMKGPYVMLPNHSNQWDPFILSWVTPRPIRWVASDAAFRDAFKHLLLAAGTIPKVKEQSDMVTLQYLREAKAQGHVAGIFPEGGQNWDGQMLELIPATAKLVRFLKLPVVVPVIKGAFLTKPRYAWRARRCRIEVEFRKAIERDEIQDMKLSEIENRIRETLVHDEYEWQKTARIPLRSRRRAEHMELAHYICPSCEGIGTLASSGNTLTCTCGYSVEVDRYGFLVYPDDGPAFDSPHDWLVWQDRFLVDQIVDKLDEAGPDGDPVLLRDRDITLMKGMRAMPMLPVHRGEARLYRNRIEVGPPGEETLVFPLRETTAANTFKQQKFEFRFEKAQYRFSMPNRTVSGYKWETAYKGLRSHLVERGEW